MKSGWYERRVLPYLIDFACGMKLVQGQRRQVVPLARGRVLEVGIGTGLNIPFYDATRVSRVVGVDPALQMHHLAQKRVARAGLEVELVGCSAEGIPLASGSVDTVLMTYTLCSIADPLAALREMRRVLHPEGRLLFCEHGRAPDAAVLRWQQRLQPHWKKLAGGCHLDRDVPALLAEAGFACEQLHSYYLSRPRAFSYHYRGVAVAV